MNAELIKALRTCADHNAVGDKCYGECPYNGNYNECVDQMILDAAAALEAAERLLDQNMKRCEALRKQLREAHESYEKQIAELEKYCRECEEIACHYM